MPHPRLERIAAVSRHPAVFPPADTSFPERRAGFSDRVGFPDFPWNRETTQVEIGGRQVEVEALAIHAPTVSAS